MRWGVTITTNTRKRPVTYESSRENRNTTSCDIIDEPENGLSSERGHDDTTFILCCPIMRVSLSNGTGGGGGGGPNKDTGQGGANRRHGNNTNFSQQHKKASPWPTTRCNCGQTKDLLLAPQSNIYTHTRRAAGLGGRSVVVLKTGWMTDWLAHNNLSIPVRPLSTFTRVITHTIHHPPLPCVGSHNHNPQSQSSYCDMYCTCG